MKELLITGGCGFIGANSALRFKDKYRVVVADDMSRAMNLTEMEALDDDESLRVVKYDVVRDRVSKSGLDLARKGSTYKESGTSFYEGLEGVIHLAAQVAVTDSIEDPLLDFNTNALGTLRTLEGIRDLNAKFVYASTNKVYGDMSWLSTVEEDTRYMWALFNEANEYVIPENSPLDPKTPYGVSKATGDFYTQEYARLYGLQTVALRQSCIYGPRQVGKESQGWLAHMAICFLQDRPITIFGDGKQVRDALFVEDLVDLYETLLDSELTGKAYSVGGGLKNTISVIELISKLERIIGKSPKIKMAEWRPSDQKVYIADNREVTKDTGWEPKTGVDEGIERMVEWLRKNLK